MTFRTALASAALAAGLSPAGPAAAQERCPSPADVYFEGGMAQALPNVHRWAHQAPSAAEPFHEDVLRGGAFHHFQAERIAAGAWLTGDMDRLREVDARLRALAEATPRGRELSPFIMAAVTVKYAEPGFAAPPEGVLDELIALPLRARFVDWRLDAREYRMARWKALARKSEVSGDPAPALEAAAEIAEALSEGQPETDRGHPIWRASEARLVRARALLAAMEAGAPGQAGPLRTLLDEMEGYATLACAPVFIGRVQNMRARLLYLEAAEMFAAAEAAHGLPIPRDAFREINRVVLEAMDAHDAAGVGLVYERVPVLWALNTAHGLPLYELFWRLQMQQTTDREMLETLYKAGMAHHACAIRKSLDLLYIAFPAAPPELEARYGGYCAPDASVEDALTMRPWAEHSD